MKLPVTYDCFKKFMTTLKNLYPLKISHPITGDRNIGKVVAMVCTVIVNVEV